MVKVLNIYTTVLVSWSSREGVYSTPTYGTGNPVYPRCTHHEFIFSRDVECTKLSIVRPHLPGSS